MRDIRTLFSLSLAALFLANPVQADLRVTFQEGAPKDQFKIVNSGACALGKFLVVIDLSGSQGGLIFDTTETGQGVEVFQPFEIVQGAERLTRLPDVQDGQTTLTLEIETLAPQEAIAFTIDVDDTLGQRAITVSGAEILGATTAFASGATAAKAVFSAGPEAVISLPDCQT